TDYEFYVQSDCGGGDESAWAGPFSFSTLCNSTTIPFSQDFEAVTTPNIPNCGSLENTGIGNDWKTNSSITGFTGKVLNYAYHSASNPGNANSWYYTQGIQMVAGVSYDISYKYGNNSTSFTESMKVAFGTAANEVAMTNQLADYPAIQMSTPVDAMHTFTAPTSGVYYIGFNSYSIEDQNQLYVDDILIVETPSCLDVSALMVSNLTPTSADLAWTENGTATLWNI
ncbi:hypothetical protein, partial [Brumimicrobium mesophilum]|uniref:hypothetical protein n=1 Tax=Brumimicrobium mesophilum TaxID=392717 RepID=UPI00131BA752